MVHKMILQKYKICMIILDLVFIIPLLQSINVYRLPNMNYLLKYSDHYYSPHILKTHYRETILSLVNKVK